MARAAPSRAAMRDVGVVVLAAGSSSRTTGSELKQFRWIAGKPMLLHSIQRFQEREDVGCVVCVLPRDRVGDPPPWIFQSDLERLFLSVGGRERGESVRNGMEDLPEAYPFVLVHDAARPLVPAELIDSVITETRKGRVVVPSLPVSDTIKELDGAGGVVAQTLDRSRLVRVQTPQGFPREILERAHAQAVAEGRTATDDAALCEAIGIPVHTVPGSEIAMKITRELDFRIAEVISREEE